MSSDKPGVLTLAYYFDPAGAVGALRPSRFHRYLNQLGYPNRVVTAIPPPNASADAGIHTTPDRAGAFWERRIADVAAGRSPESMPFDCQIERLLRKTIWPGEFALAWSRDAATEAASVIRSNPRISVVLSTYPPLGTHLAALRLTRQLPLRWIADFRDPFGRGDSFLAKKGMGRFERTVFQRADAIIANTESAAVRWRESMPWAAHKIHVIWNGYDPQEDISALPIPERSERWLVHAGNLYRKRNANILVAGLARLRAKGHPAAGNVRIVLAGPFDETAGIDRAAYDKAKAEGWLDMSGRSVPRQEAQRLTREADGLLLVQPQSAVQVPAKLFEYLSISRPILALTPRNSAIEWILEKAGVPFVCVHAEDDTETVERKLIEYLELPNTPTPPNDWYRTTFDAQKQSGQLAGIIDRLPARS